MIEGIVIKGVRQGLLVTLPEGEWGGLLGDLEAHLGENPAFFSGGRMAVDVADRTVTPAGIEQLRSVLVRHQVELWALVSDNTDTEAAARDAGLVTELSPLNQIRSPLRASEGVVDRALVTQRVLRSGQSLRHPGHIVVIGDVNPGAKLVAGGSVVVWGRLRGLVHAGALGDEDAVICALELAPTQLRIGEQISRSPGERSAKPGPELASIHNGRIVAVRWAGE